VLSPNTAPVPAPSFANGRLWTAAATDSSGLMER